MNELYYEHPVQLKYWDTGLGKYVGGIGYHDFIICGCCGRACSIAEIVDEGAKLARLDPDKTIIELDWIDINEEIVGN